MKTITLRRVLHYEEYSISIIIAQQYAGKYDKLVAMVLL